MTSAEVDAVAAKLRGNAVAPTDAGTADGTRESPPPADAERKQRTSKNARRGKLKAAVLRSTSSRPTALPGATMATLSKLISPTCPTTS
jgi:hypothetical protein